MRRAKHNQERKVALRVGRNTGCAEESNVLKVDKVEMEVRVQMKQMIGEKKPEVQGETQMQNFSGKENLELTNTRKIRQRLLMAGV